MEDSAARYRDLPPPASFSDAAVIKTLGDGLVHRHAGPGDVEALAAFNAVALANPPDYEATSHLPIWVRELAGGDHPRMRAEDFSIIEDIKLHRIVSTCSLLSHTLSYEGVAFEAGQPELVATHPDYRRRGLVRLQFEELHRWSAKRGQLLQLIDGIPWYYRQFGYEYALEHFEGRVVRGSRLAHEALPKDIRVRPATPADLPFIQQLYARQLERSLLGSIRPEHCWRYELGRDPLSYGRRELRVVEREGEGSVALYAHYPILILSGALFVTFLEVAPGVSWQPIADTVLGELGRTGEQYAKRDGGSFEELQVLLGCEHPVYDEAPDLLRVRRPGSGYYVRVPDIVGFLRVIAPALERRLAGSKQAGYSGAIALNLYRSGVRIEFDCGRVRGVEEWAATREQPGHVALPDLTVLQLLFGFRSLSELRSHFVDALVQDGPEGATAQVLFPKRASPIWLTW